jgi:transcriptional antiterminator RfaH
MTNKHWYVIYTKPRQEEVAKINLERQGYVTYLPMIRQVRRRRGQRISVVAPMFPRYMFIQLDSHTDNWAPIRSTRGVTELVKFAHRPAEAPPELVEMLQSREDEQGIQVLPADDFKAGGRVRITEGGLAGYEGVFLARTSRHRVAVLLEIMGKYARTQVDVAAIEPAG